MKKLLLKTLAITAIFHAVTTSSLHAMTLRHSVCKSKQSTHQTNTNKSTISQLIAFAEDKHGVPQNLLSAIAKIESKHTPWAINAKGRSFQFKTKEEAVACIERLRREGVTNINIGVMQLNWASHRRNFKSIDDMLDPLQNISYAARLIKKLKSHQGSWERAVQYYHSADPEHHHPYKNKVFCYWAKIKPREKVHSISTGNEMNKLYSPCLARMAHNYGAKILPIADKKKELSLQKVPENMIHEEIAVLNNYFQL